MKKIIMGLIFIMSLSIGRAADPVKPVNVSSKSVNITEPFDRIVIGENLKVLLQGNSSSSAIVDGSSRYLKNVNLRVDKGTLYISASSFVNPSEGTIYLSVGDMKNIQVKRNASITSQGFLKCNRLIVMLEEDAKANLKTLGHLQIVPSKDCELDFEENVTISAN